MATAVFHIRLDVQNVESDEHIEAIENAIEQAASLLGAHAIMILGKSCLPKITACGESFVKGSWTVRLRRPDEIE
jgi:ABC-type molybdate transport system permease subunit